MKVDLDNGRLGIPMMFPVTWEENVAANMTQIPTLELFPGLMVKDLYKCYREGIIAGKIQPWNGSDPQDLTVGYISDTSGKYANVVRDFLDAMILTVNQGKAPASILTGQADTGMGEKIDTATSKVTKAATGPLITIGIIAAGAFALYLMSIGFLPKPQFKQ